MNFEQIDLSRNKTAKEHETRAEERNNYRTLWQKITGQEKSSEMDMAIEEALRMDEEINNQLLDGKAKSTTEAIENIKKEKKFAFKGKETIGKEELVRFRTLYFAGALEKNNFTKAYEIVQQVQKDDKMDDESRKILKETMAPLITKKIVELAQGRDGENFVEAFHTFGKLQSITTEGVSREDLQSPEIQNAIKKDIVENSHSPQAFIVTRDNWVKAGVIDAEAANKLEEVRERVLKLIEGNTYSAQAFIVTRDGWVEAGVIDAETANNLESVRARVKQQIEGNSHSPQAFIVTRDNWVEAGVIDAETANKLEEVRERARKQIEGNTYSLQAFTAIRDSWVEAGVVNNEEVASWPEIVKMKK
jgi:uncharacterized protein YifN (PemK superfamily)